MGAAGQYKDVISLCKLISEMELDIIKTENLYRFDGKISFSLGQGQ
jgi:isocitrate dehydrogenase